MQQKILKNIFNTNKYFLLTIHYQIIMITKNIR